MGVGGQRHAFTPGKDAVPIVQKSGWAPGPVWIGAENLAPTWIRSPDLPAHSDWTILDPIKLVADRTMCKSKGKGRFLELFQHWGHLAYCILPPNKFPHSSPEAPCIIQMCETSTSEGGNYYKILLANSNLRKSARIFYMPQSWDMGQILLLRIFRTPEKSNGFGRVWTRELRFQWPVC